MATDNPRAAALAKLAELGVKVDPTAVAESKDVKVERTGEEVYAGGEVERVLVRPAHLTYREGTELLHAFAVVGDTVLLTEKAAKRLDDLGATATKAQAAKLGKAPAAPTPATSVTSDGVTVDATPSAKTDEELKAMNAKELIAHVNQHPGDKVRVRALEGNREEPNGPRSTVLKATAPDGEDDDDEELDGEE